MAGCGTPGANEAVDERATPTELSLPATGGSIAEILVATPELSRLAEALDRAGLLERFGGDQAYTLFAPTDSAFERMPPGALEGLMRDGNQGGLRALLAAHVLDRPMGEAELQADVARGNGRWELRNLRGTTLTVTSRGGWTVIGLVAGGEAVVSTPDIVASNGVVHAVESVLVSGY